MQPREGGAALSSSDGSHGLWSRHRFHSFGCWPRPAAQIRAAFLVGLRRFFPDALDLDQLTSRLYKSVWPTKHEQTRSLNFCSWRWTSVQLCGRQWSRFTASGPAVYGVAFSDGLACIAVSPPRTIPSSVIDNNTFWCAVQTASSSPQHRFRRVAEKFENISLNDTRV